MKTNYLSNAYDSESHPYTTYPEKLCKYLYDRFNFNNGMKLLEVGCGRGEFLRNFKNLGLSVYGCDLSDEAKEYLEDFDIKITDADNEPCHMKIVALTSFSQNHLLNTFIILKNS